MAEASVVAINGVTPNGLWIFFAVLVGLCLTFTAVVTAYEKLQNLRKPHSTQESKVMDMLSHDKRRLDEQEARIARLENKQENSEEGLRVTCAGVMALLDHAIHNGNEDQMNEASRDINKYLRGQIGG